MNSTPQQAEIRASDENESLKPTLNDGSIEKHELHDFWQFDHSAGKFNMVRFSPVHRIDVLTCVFAQASSWDVDWSCICTLFIAASSLTCMRVLGRRLWPNSARVAEAGSQAHDEGSWSHRESILCHVPPQRPSSSAISCYRTPDAAYTRIWCMLPVGSNRVSVLRDPQEPPLPLPALRLHP